MWSQSLSIVNHNMWKITDGNKSLPLRTSSSFSCMPWDVMSSKHISHCFKLLSKLRGMSHAVVERRCLESLTLNIVSFCSPSKPPRFTEHLDKPSGWLYKKDALETFNLVSQLFSNREWMHHSSFVCKPIRASPCCHCVLRTSTFDCC